MSHNRKGRHQCPSKMPFPLGGNPGDCSSLRALPFASFSPFGLWPHRFPIFTPVSPLLFLTMVPQGFQCPRAVLVHHHGLQSSPANLIFVHSPLLCSRLSCHHSYLGHTQPHSPSSSVSPSSLFLAHKSKTPPNSSICVQPQFI